MPQLEGLRVRNKRSCKTQLRPRAVKYTNYAAENRATMGRVLCGGLEGWKPVPNLRWFTPQDGSPRSTSRAFPQSPARTPPFYGSLNSQVLLYPLFPSRTPSTRCGLEESVLRDPGLLTSSPWTCGGCFTTSFTRCSTESVCRVLSAQIRSTRVSWDVLAAGTICREEDRPLRETTKRRRTPRKHSVTLAPRGRDVF